MNTNRPTLIPAEVDATVLLAEAAAAAVFAKANKVDATKQFSAAEAAAIDALIVAGVESFTMADGTKVTLKGGFDGEVGRSIDADALAERVTAITLDRVTKRVIDLAAFDAAVEVGLIDADTVEAVVTETPKKRSLVITAPVANKR